MLKCHHQIDEELLCKKVEIACLQMILLCCCHQRLKKLLISFTSNVFPKCTNCHHPLPNRSSYQCQNKVCYYTELQVIIQLEYEWPLLKKLALIRKQHTQKKYNTTCFAGKTDSPGCHVYITHPQSATDLVSL